MSEDRSDAPSGPSEGLAWLQAVVAGEQRPSSMSGLLGFRILSASAEEVVAEALPGPDHVNGGGIVHGGFLSALLDSATGWAVHAQLAPGHLAPHTQLSVHYIAAGLPGQPLRCRARALKVGRRVAAAEAEITQGDRLVARAMSSHAIIARP